MTYTSAIALRAVITRLENKLANTKAKDEQKELKAKIAETRKRLAEAEKVSVKEVKQAAAILSQRALKAHVTRTQEKMKGTRGKKRAAFVAKVKDLESRISA